MKMRDRVVTFFASLRILGVQYHLVGNGEKGKEKRKRKGKYIKDALLANLIEALQDGGGTMNLIDRIVAHQVR